MTNKSPEKGYRKIYEQHYGPIPKDKEGRTYDIHHIDGDRSNNDPQNLVALTIQQHYDVHFDQGEWIACCYIAQRMNVSPEILSELATRHANERVANGTHHWQGPDSNNKRIAEGTHPFLNKNFQSKMAKKRVYEGTYHFLGGNIQREAQQKIVAAGEHPFQDSEWHRKAVQKQLLNGNHASQKKMCCIQCKKEVDSANFNRWHGESCKHKGKIND